MYFNRNDTTGKQVVRGWLRRSFIDVHPKDYPKNKESLFGVCVAQRNEVL